MSAPTYLLHVHGFRPSYHHWCEHYILTSTDCVMILSSASPITQSYIWVRYAGLSGRTTLVSSLIFNFILFLNQFFRIHAQPNNATHEGVWWLKTRVLDFWWTFGVWTCLSDCMVKYQIKFQGVGHKTPNFRLTMQVPLSTKTADNSYHVVRDREHFTIIDHL